MCRIWMFEPVTFFAPTPPVEYLFIDGGCVRLTLEKISNQFFDGIKIELNYYELTKRYNKVFYYDSLPPKRQEENDIQYQQRIEPDLRFLAKLAAFDRFHVYEGEVRRSKSRKRNEQKKVDIMIAVDMLTHSFRRNMQRATLLTSDLDFKPLIDALVQEVCL